MARETDVARLVARHGTTYAEAAGIRLQDTPAPLWQLLVLSLLLSARISSDVAVAAASELFRAGLRTPQRMQASTRQERVAALGRARYRRYDERTATQLGDLADAVLRDYGGDLRRLRDRGEVGRRLQRFAGIGPVGSAIFCREVQGVWPDLAPYVDDLTADGAARLGLPRSAAELAGLVPAADLTRLVAACVRAALREDVVADVRGSSNVLLGAEQDCTLGV